MRTDDVSRNGRYLASSHKLPHQIGYLFLFPFRELFLRVSKKTLTLLRARLADWLSFRSSGLSIQSWKDP